MLTADKQLEVWPRGCASGSRDTRTDAMQMGKVAKRDKWVTSSLVRIRTTRSIYIGIGIY